MHSEKPLDTRESSWPTASILIWGTFGSKTPEGRRFHRRTIAALAVMIIGYWAAFLYANVNPEQPWLWRILPFVPAAGFGVVAWEFRRYVHSLDELAQRIQLEAVLLTYLTGLVLAILLGQLQFFALGAWHANPAYFIFLEPVRAGWLYVIARRY